MQQPKGIDWESVSFVVGQREDKLPHPLPEPLFRRTCARCSAETYTETEYPLDVPVLCNVCAAAVAKDAEEDPSSLLQWDIPIALKARLIDIAQERRLPIEDICREFLQWKLGRPTQAGLFIT
jgi:hypothetical protein